MLNGQIITSLTILMPRLHLTVSTTRNGKLVFVKTNFQVLKLKFYACNFKQAFYSFHKLYIRFHKLYIVWPWQPKNAFRQAFRSVHGCQTRMCKRDIKHL